MAQRKRSVVLVVVLWLAAFVLLAVLFVTYNDTRMSHRSTGFPYMPLYGAMTWWFFMVIPLIGWTWGYFNDLRDTGIRDQTSGAKIRESSSSE